MIKLIEILKEIYKTLNEASINDKGELEDFSFPSEKETEDAAKLQSLGFEIKPIDPDEKLYYLELSNGRISVASKNKDIILKLKIQYPETWKDAVLKYDNKWHS
jgi:hypothetical protein